MKKLLISALLSLMLLMGSAQKISYQLRENIHYYNDSVCRQDIYINEQCMLDIYYPVNTKDVATVVWFHGGGLTGGQKEIPAELKQQGICVVGVGYRLSPRVQSPAYISDAAASLSWVLKNIGSYNGNPKRVFVAGHSAGAYLACMVVLDKKWLGQYGMDANQIAGLISFSAQTITHFTIRKEQGIADTQPLVDAYAPLFHVRKDAPPILLMTGDREQEMLGRYEENAYLMRMLKIVGHRDVQLFELQGYGHNMISPGIPLMLKWLNQHHAN
jgi:acetyl esterase/lipase